MDRNDVKTGLMSLSRHQRADFGLGELILASRKGLSASRMFNLLEIVAVSSVYFWMAWIVTPFFSSHGLRLFPLAVTVFTVIYVAYLSPVLIHRESLASRGLGPASAGFIRTDNLGPAVAGFGIFALAGAGVLLGGGGLLSAGPWFDYNGATFSLRLVIYACSAFFQDGLFFSFFLRRWQVVWQTGETGAAVQPGSRADRFREDTPRLWLALLANAGLFSLYHLPNWPIMPLALVLGLAWGRLFCRTPNLLAAVLGHAFLGTVLHLSLKFSTKVGSAYYLGHKGFYPAVFSFLEPWINGRFQW